MNKQKVSVLFVIDSLDCGGAEKSLVSLLPLLDYTKMQVDLMLVKRGGIFEQYVPSNVHIISLPPIRGWRKLWFKMCLLFFSFSLKILCLIKKNRHPAEVRWIAMHSAYPKMKQKYDVAIAYQQGFPTYYVATKVNALKKCGWVNADLHQAGYREKFNRFFYDKLTWVIPVSDILRNMLEKMQYTDSKKLYTIYDILNVELIRSMAQEHGFDDELPNNVSRIVTVGRMVAPKNYPLAIETAKLLKEKGLAFRWYFIGDGPQRSYIADLIKQYSLGDYICMLGMRPNPYPYMANCDIYVQTSTFEGYGLTLCEARILHKPEISTNFPVVYNQICDGRNGLIAEMNAKSISDKILYLIEHPEVKNLLIENTKLEKNCTALTESEKINALLLD